MLARKSDVVKTITSGVEYLFKKNKITWLKGTASFDSDKSVIVTDKTGKQKKYQSAKTVIATGSAPIEIPSCPFDGKNIVHSSHALEFDKVPKHLVVIGGGVIGLEMGSVWQRLEPK